MKKNRVRNESSDEKLLDFDSFEVPMLWTIYEKSIEIGGSGDAALEHFRSLRIPALILLYELVNCNEMKALTAPTDDGSSSSSEKKLLSIQTSQQHQQNAKILENLCELIDAEVNEKGFTHTLT